MTVISDRQTQFEAIFMDSTATRDGRRFSDLDLHGVQCARPGVNWKTTISEVATRGLVGLPEVWALRLERTDLGSSDLRELRLHGSTLKECRFDGSDCRNWRVWASSFSSCSFKDCDLRKSTLGGIENGVACCFENVDFSGADMRGTVYKVGVFVGCKFIESRIEGVDFQDSVFVDCVFGGQLRNVIFYSRTPPAPGIPSNEMRNVDFRKACLRHVEFRGIDLSSILPPEDGDHFVLPNFRDWLQARLARIRSRNDKLAMSVRAFLESAQKWQAGATSPGIINRKDVLELLGLEGLELLDL